MTTAAQRRRHEGWLLEVTGIPTASGREDRVAAWVRHWAEARRDLRVAEDAAGNLLITQKRRSSRKPVVFTAHMDHPAFVVREVIDRRTLDLEFRGGVHDPYFEDAAVDVFDRDDEAHRGRIRSLDPKARPFKRVEVRLSRATDAVAVGDVGRWAFRGPGREPTVRRGILHCPACDDLAALAAALAALDVLRKRKGTGHVGVLLTTAEEVGFIGAIAACKNRSVPRGARLICLENSRSFPDSPIGGGPILRVGDRMSVFAPELTNQISEMLRLHVEKHPNVAYQRKLMPGGTCEATTFASYGYESTCVCLPLGNYHNMSEIDEVLAGKRPARVAPECIAVDDYHGMVEMLVLCAEKLDDAKVPALRGRMEQLYDQYGHVVE
jgi:endoglucanase